MGVGIVKRFGPVLANAGIDFDLQRGEIHAILGENGAGKSTFVKLVSGFLRPDEGEIWLNNQRVVFQSPRDALHAGVALVHQNFKLIKTFTALENIVLGLADPLLRPLPLAKHRRALTRLADESGFQVDLDRRVNQLSEGEKQRVEILKVLYRNVRVLLLDEPTSVLTPAETTALFPLLRRLVEGETGEAEGMSIIFITHKLDEAMTLSDRMTVFRAGQVVHTTRPADTSPAQLAEMMIGHEPRQLTRQLSSTATGGQSDPLPLRIERLTVHDDRGLVALDDLSLEVRPGEIVGLAGVEGNGQLELAETVAGIRHPTSGRVIIEGQDVTGWAPREIHKAGLAFIPEAHGLVHTFSVAENSILDRFWAYFKHSWYDRMAAETRAQSLVDHYRIRTPSLQTLAADLSGGNRQKLVVGRKLCGDEVPHRVIVAAQPTRGLDVNTKTFVHQQFVEWARRDVPTLIISSDLDELLDLCDRLAVINRGRIVGVFDSSRDIQPAELGQLMTSRRPQEATGGK